MPLPTVGVVIPTFQRASTLERTLNALCAVDYPDELLAIVVVDDGADDATAATVTGFPRVRYLGQPNSGVAAARNRGARLVAGDILLFIDDDIIVAPDNIRRHLAVRAEYGECIVAGYPFFDAELQATLARTPFGRFRLWTEGRFQDDDASSWGSDGRVRPLTVATGNMSISRRLFWDIGGFDEKFPVGAEDQDLCWRARTTGAAIVRDYDIRVVHNDQHQDLRSLCTREERSAIGLVYLVRKHPDFPAPCSLILNGPLRRTDSPRLRVRKIVRAAMSRSFPLSVCHRIIRGIELVRPRGGWPLHDVYRCITGLYVFRGVRRGLRLTSGETWLHGHDPRRRDCGTAR